MAQSAWKTKGETARRWASLRASRAGVRRVFLMDSFIEIRNSAREPLSSDRGGSAVLLSKEALQKYPEQSFAQKFSLCNRQKFSWRKIKEGF